MADVLSFSSCLLHRDVSVDTCGSGDTEASPHYSGLFEMYVTRSELHSI